MAFVGPKGGGGWGGGGGRPLLVDALTLLVATAVAGGAVGDDMRWLGGLALSELVVNRGLWWSGALRGRPWARLGLRLAAATALLGVLDIAMPDASVVASAFLVTTVGCLALLAALWLADEGPRRRRQVLALMALYGSVGLWFAVVGVPPSGWSPIVALLAVATAVDTTRLLDGPPANRGDV